MDSKVTTKDVGVIYDYLAKRVNTLEKRLLDACRSIDEPTALGTLTELLDTSHVKQVSENLASQLQTPTIVATYMLSSLTIRQACNALTTSGDEDLKFATGLAVAPMTYAITLLLNFELKRKTIVAAEGEQQAVARLLIGLHNADHKLYMTWHSHPGEGEGSTRPSHIDMDFHRRLEAGGYPVIGGIVNRQGYVRFFSYKRPFNVSIYGKGLEVIDEQNNVFKLGKCGAI